MAFYNSVRQYALLAICTPLAAQTVYLRTPGTGFCKVAGASNATPIRLTVINPSLCGIVSNGQTILVTEVRGNTSANIHLENAADTVNLVRKVANLSGNAFDLQDLAGNPVAGNGTYVNGGRVGLASLHTLQSHPRLYLDGPAGPIRTSVSSTAPTGRANASNLLFTALKNSGPGWTTGWGSDRSGARGVGSALHWLADGDSAARTRALTSLANITQVLGTPACDENERGCYAPASAVADYPAQFMEQFAQAYSIMHGEMTSGDRANFVNFVLSDLPWTQGGLDYTGVARTKPTWKVSNMATSGTVEATGTSVTGTDTHFLTDVAIGDVVVLPHSAENVYAVGYRVAAVNSDVELTLSEPINGPLVPAGSHYMVGPQWDDSLYGLTWFTKHFDASLMCGGATQTYPEALIANCEAGYGLQAGLDQSGTQNLVLARLLGYYSIGLAACGDDPRACLLLTLANEWFTDVALPRAMAVWTGFSQSNPSYHVGRMYNIITSIGAMSKNSFVEQPDYLANTRIMTNGALWGVGAAMPGFNFYLPNAEAALYEISPFLMRGPMVSLFGAPASDEARYYKDWIVNRFGNYNESFIRFNGGEYTWFQFLYTDPATTPLAAPTTTHFGSTERDRCVAVYGAAVCPSNEGRYMSTSRQNWNTGASYVGFNATSYRCLDHCGDDAGGWLLMAKNGKMMLSGDAANYMGSRAGRGYVELGGTSASLRTHPEIGPVNVYWMGGNDDFMVSNVDLTGTFTAASLASSISRQVIHLKSGTQDYVVDHVRAVASAPAAIRGLQHFHLNECGVPAATTCVEMNAASATVTNTQPGAKMISRALGIGGNVLIGTQSGVETDGSYPGGADKTFRWSVCPTSNGTSCADVASVEWAVVHKLSTNTADTLPAIVQAATGSFRIVEIQDPAFPKVAVFTASGVTATSAAFTTSHAGVGQYVVSGLEPGPYTITSNGAPVGIEVAGVGENSIGFQAASGEISIVPGPPPLTIATTSFPNAALGKPYLATAAAISSTTPYTWQLTAGTLCAGLTLSQSGDQAVVSGSASALGTCAFTLQVTNSTSTQIDSKVFSITVVEPGPPVGIATVLLPAGRLADSYSGTLQASGGTLPLAWSVTAGALCPGLILNPATGQIRGTATQLGVCVFTVRVTDIGNDFVERELFIAVVENTQTALFINPVDASHSGAILHFGRRGLDFAAACSLVLRLGNASGTVLATLPSASGHSRRALVAEGLPSGQTIHAAVTCGTGSAEAQFETGFAPPAPRPVKLVFHPPASTPPIADVVLSYDTTPSLLESLTASCSAGTCTAVVITNEPLLYWRAVYRDASANVVGTSGLHRIAPR